MVVYWEGYSPVLLIKPARFVGIRERKACTYILSSTVLDGWISGVNFQQRNFAHPSSSVVEFFFPKQFQKSKFMIFGVMS